MLTLFTTPVVYLLFDRLATGLGTFLARRRSRQEGLQPPPVLPEGT